MRTVFLSIAGILLHLDAAGRSVFKKRDDFEPTGRFWTSLYRLFQFCHFFIWSKDVDVIPGVGVRVLRAPTPRSGRV